MGALIKLLLKQMREKAVMIERSADKSRLTTEGAHRVEDAFDDLHSAIHAVQNVVEELL